MNQCWKIFALALAFIAALYAGDTLSLAEDQTAPQIKVVPLDPGDQS